MKKAIYIFLVFTLILVGCKSKKPLNKQDLKEPKIETIEISRLGINISAMERKLHVSSSVQFIVDSILIISIQPIEGFEMFRIEADETNFMVIDRMNRKYARHSWDYLQNKFKLKMNLNKLAKTLTNKKEMEKLVQNDGLVVFGELLQKDSFYYPSSILLNASIGNKTVSAAMDIKKIDFNKRIDIKRLDVSKYKLVTFSNILPF